MSEGAPSLTVTTLRLEQGLLDRAKAGAAEERRSLNSQIVVLIEKWLDETEGRLAA